MMQTPMAHLFKWLHVIVKRDVTLLETDPSVQYQYHKYATVVWLSAIFVVPFLSWIYNHDLGILIIIEISLYANFATEFGSMASSEAAMSGRNVVNVVTPDALPGTIAPAIIEQSPIETPRA